MEKGDLITYRGVEYIVTSLRNGVHAVLASTDDEAGTSGSSRYLGSIDDVEAELAEPAETAEEPDAPAAQRRGAEPEPTMTATYQDVAQMIRDGVSAEEIEAVLADERTALTDEQIEALRSDLAARDADDEEDDEEDVWVARDGEGGETTLDADSPEEARRAAIDWARGGDWGCEGGTVWVHVTYGLAGSDDEETVTVAIDPDEPECAEGHEHDWVSPYWLLGGCEENPGVWGHGGGVVIAAACRHCGAKRTTDTWAQDPETGRQGLTSVRYEEDVYRAEFAARGAAAADEADIQTEEEARAAVEDRGELFRAAYLARMDERRSEEEEEEEEEEALSEAAAD